MVAVFFQNLPKKNCISMMLKGKRKRRQTDMSRGKRKRRQTDKESEKQRKRERREREERAGVSG